MFFLYPKAKRIKDAIEDLKFEVDEFPDQEIAVCRLRIKGMACTSCSESVERALLMVDGVKKAIVGLALEEAKIHFDPNVTDSVHLIEAIEDAGFGADLISSGDDFNKVHLKVEGLNSSEDATIMKSYLEAVEGVNHIEIDEGSHKVIVAFDPDLTGPRSLIERIQEAGHGPNIYHASLYTTTRARETEQHHEITAYRNQFLWSCLFSVPVFMFSMVLPMFSPFGDWLSYKLYNNLNMGMLLRWVFCTPVQFIIGWRYDYECISLCDASFVYITLRNDTCITFYKIQ